MAHLHHNRPKKGRLHPRRSPQKNGRAQHRNPPPLKADAPPTNLPRIPILRQRHQRSTLQPRPLPTLLPHTHPKRPPARGGTNLAKHRGASLIISDLFF